MYRCNSSCANIKCHLTSTLYEHIQKFIHLLASSQLLEQ